MGFFIEDEGPQVARAKKVAPIYGEPGCNGCNLKSMWPQLLSYQMPMRGRRDAEILIIADSPKYEEDVAGIPMAGLNLDRLNVHIPQGFKDRVAWQNMARCMPPGMRTPTAAEVNSCSIHLQDDLGTMKNLRAIIGLGQTPLSYFAPGLQIHECHGMPFPIRVHGRVIWYFPAFHPAYIAEKMRKDSDDFTYSHFFPVFQADLRRFFKEFERWSDPYIADFQPCDVIIPTSESDARGLIERMKGSLGHDLETTCLRPYMRDAKILSASFSDGETTIAFPVDHPGGPTDWGWRIIDETVTQRRWIAHSAPMELAWIWWRKGIEWYPEKFEDTMALGRIIQARESMQSLDDMCRIHLGVALKAISNLDTKRMSSYPLHQILPYNGLDALGCKWLFSTLEPRLTRNTEAAYDDLLRTIRSTTAMELAGLPLDTKANEEFYQDFTRRIAETAKATRNVYEVKEFERKYATTFNIGSPDHVAKALVEFGKCKLPMSPGGKKYSTTDEELEKLAGKNPLAALLQDHREYTKLLSTYVMPFRPENMAPDGMIHAAYKCTFTKTLRLSSEDPNIQNFPKHKHREVRKQISPKYIRHLGWGDRTFPISDKPHVIVAVDSGQIQARILAMMTKDPKLCDAIITGYDIHSDWRDRLLEIFPEYIEHLKHKSGETEMPKLLKAGRSEIKSDFVFSSMFGAGPKSCADRVGAPLHIMEQLQGDFFHEFSTARKWIKKMRAQYKETGETFSPTGQRRYSVLTGNEPLNNPIQAGERDIMLATQNDLCELALKTGDYYLMPRINIHDDLSFIMPDDENLMKRIDIIGDAMVECRFDWIIVPLMAEISIGDNWADIEEIGKVTGTYKR